MHFRIPAADFLAFLRDFLCILGPTFYAFWQFFREMHKKSSIFCVRNSLPKTGQIITPTTILLAQSSSLKKTPRITAKNMKQKQKTNLR